MEKTIKLNAKSSLDNNNIDIHKISGFEIMKEEKSNNPYANQYLVKRNNQFYTLYIYRYGEEINKEAFNKLIEIDGISNPVEMGSIQNRDYVLFENISGIELGDGYEDINLVEFMKSITSTLQNLHTNNLYHLNLNFESIKILSYEPLSILLDNLTCLSVNNSEKSKILTNTKGEGDFKSPEVSLGIASNKSDYWSLGIILHYILCKKYPEKNLFTQEVKIDESIDENCKKLLRGLLHIDINKRFAYEEIIDWLGGKEVEVSENKVFRYNSLEFSSIEQFILYLHKDKDGLDTFKKLLFRGYFDKYATRETLEKIKNSLGELNAFYYRYGRKNQKLLFEGLPLYLTELWLGKNYDNLHMIKDSSIKHLYFKFDFLKKYGDFDKLCSFDYLYGLNIELEKVKGLIDFELGSFGVEGFTYLKEAVTADLKINDTEYLVNSKLLEEIVRLDKNLDYFKLMGLYKDIDKIEKNKVVPLLKYRYFYPEFEFKGDFYSADLEKFIPLDYLNLKYYFIENKAKITELNELYKKDKDFILCKKNYLFTKYLMCQDANDNTILETFLVEKDKNYIDYLCYLYDITDNKRGFLENKEGILVVIAKSREKGVDLDYLLDKFTKAQIFALYKSYINNDIDTIVFLIKKVSSKIIKTFSIDNSNLDSIINDFKKLKDLI